MIIQSPYEKKRTIQSLESLLKIKEFNFFFPFCLFHKSFYSNFRELKTRPYTGYVSETEFEFYKSIHYGILTSGTQTSRELKIKGILRTKWQEKCPCFENE